MTRSNAHEDAYTSLTAVLLVLLLTVAACGSTPAPAADAPAADAPAPDAAPTAAPAKSAADAAADAPAESALAETSAAAGGFQTFVIDPSQSTASYLVSEEFFADALRKYGIDAGLNDVVGTTSEIQGQLEVDVANAQVGAGEFSVNIATLSTDRDLRDGWIRDNGPRLNDYPTATFVVTGVENAPTSYTPGEEVTFQLVGDMTIREVTQPLTFDVTASVADGVLTGTALADTQLTDWGIEPPSFANTLTVADPFSIKVDFVATAQ
ncbi:MAG: YceI family protein [Caldilineaceae bacterium]